MDGLFKEVDYFGYCKHCINKDVKQTEEPCNTCLHEPARQYTRKPLKFVDDGTLKKENK